MLKAAQITVGGFYVSDEKGVVREVWDEKNGDVYWRAYSLGSGEPLGGLVCSKQHLARWADREATLEEVAGLKRGAARTEEVERTMKVVERGCQTDCVSGID